MSFVKVKGKGHLLDNPLFSIWNWNFPSLHDLAGWIETFLILILIFALANPQKVAFNQGLLVMSQTIGQYSKYIQYSF